MSTICSVRVTAASLAVVTAFIFSASLAIAQDPAPGLAEVREPERPGRGGFWLGLGVGAGGESFDLSPSVGYSNVLYKPTVSFRLGGTLGQQLRLGAEVLSWINEVGPAVESLSSALFITQFYPWSSAGLYLKGGVGIGRNAVDFDDGYGEGDTGFAGLIGAGYELRLSKRFFLNPSIDLVGHRYDHGAAGDYRERLVNFGLGIILQTGR